MRRSYAGGVKGVTLTAPITEVSTSMGVSNLTGVPSGVGGPFAVVVDKGEPTEEKMLITAASGGSMAIGTRGYDGTTTQPHGSGAEVRLVITSIDADEANAHVQSALGVHGAAVGDALVSVSGVQSLVNKTLDGDLNTIQDLKLALQPEIIAAIAAEAGVRAAGDALRYLKTEADAQFAPIGQAEALLNLHVADPDPHEQYLIDWEGLNPINRRGLQPTDLPRGVRTLPLWGDFGGIQVTDAQPLKTLATVTLPHVFYPDDYRRIYRVSVNHQGFTSSGADSDQARMQLAFNASAFNVAPNWIGWSAVGRPQQNAFVAGNVSIARNGQGLMALLDVPEDAQDGSINVTLEKLSGTCNPTISNGTLTVELLVI